MQPFCGSSSGVKRGEHDRPLIHVGHVYNITSSMVSVRHGPWCNTRRRVVCALWDQLLRRCGSYRRSELDDDKQYNRGCDNTVSNKMKKVCYAGHTRRGWKVATVTWCPRSLILGQPIAIVNEGHDESRFAVERQRNAAKKDLRSQMYYVLVHGEIISCNFKHDRLLERRASISCPWGERIGAIFRAR